MKWNETILKCLSSTKRNRDFNDFTSKKILEFPGGFCKNVDMDIYINDFHTWKF